MPNGINLNSNDIQNGFIFKDLTRQIRELESKIEYIIEAAKNLNVDKSGKISLYDYEKLLEQIAKKVDKESFDKHIKNNEIHTSIAEKLICESLHFKEVSEIEVKKDKKGEKVVQLDIKLNNGHNYKINVKEE